MPSPFAAALDAAQRAVRSTAGEAVTYRRGADEVAIPDAVPAAPRPQTLDPATRLGVEARLVDFLIAAERLAELDPPTPQEGDHVLHTAGGATRTYEVLSPGGDEPAWRWTDLGHTTARVHVKQIAEEATPP